MPTTSNSGLRRWGEEQLRDFLVVVKQTLLFFPESHPRKVANYAPSRRGIKSHPHLSTKNPKAPPPHPQPWQRKHYFSPCLLRKGLEFATAEGGRGKHKGNSPSFTRRRVGRTRTDAGSNLSPPSFSCAAGRYYLMLRLKKLLR